MYIPYKDFKNMLDQKIKINSKEYTNILKKIIENPHRYSEVFRVTNINTKIIQNLTQSNEIKFGDFLEDIISEYIQK
ncbi:hypothetical protein [Ureaplasma canigenitalium]|uniref:hypothetical protein n=1 Tax=Ureaplasma canigenitalium TaxID=42092 RepID=UPI00069010B0|nr:hypothetical protein [Ureaplasma canigenitalium]